MVKNLGVWHQQKWSMKLYYQWEMVYCCYCSIYILYEHVLLVSYKTLYIRKKICLIYCIFLFFFWSIFNMPTAYPTTFIDIHKSNWKFPCMLVNPSELWHYFLQIFSINSQQENDQLVFFIFDNKDPTNHIAPGQYIRPVHFSDYFTLWTFRQLQYI